MDVLDGDFLVGPSAMLVQRMGKIGEGAAEARTEVQMRHPTCKMLISDGCSFVAGHCRAMAGDHLCREHALQRIARRVAKKTFDWLCRIGLIGSA